MTALLELSRTHAPLLLVGAPLVGAALAVLASSVRAGGLIGALAGIAAAAVAADFGLRGLFANVLPPSGSVLVVDGVALFATPIIATGAALALIAMGASARSFAGRGAPFAVALTLGVSAGWMGALLTRDLVGLFLMAEIAWLSATGLTALSAERDRGALNGALRMLGVGGVAAALHLLGLGLIYRSIGSLELAALANAHVETPALAAAGVGLVAIGLAFKAGLAPLHGWMGPAFGRSAGVVALALGVVGSVGAVATMVRLAAYAIPAPTIGAGLSLALAALGGVSIVIGSVQAVGAKNLQRLAAYAIAAQSGGVLVCAALGSPAGFAAALTQLFAMFAATLALLGGSAAAGARTLIDLDGVGRRAPIAGAAITASALCLMGAPLTIGFLGRWRLVEAGIGAGWWWAAGAMIAASLAGVFYGGRIVERLYFRRAEAVASGTRDLWRIALVPALAVAIAAIALAFAPAPLLDAARAATALLTGTGA